MDDVGGGVLGVGGWRRQNGTDVRSDVATSCTIPVMNERQKDRSVGDPLAIDTYHKPRPPPVLYVMPPYWTLWSGSASPQSSLSAI